MLILNYRTWGIVFAFIFGWISTIIWNTVTVITWNATHVAHKGEQPAPHALVLALGLGILAITIWATLWFIYNRIELDDAEGRAYNFLNQLKFQAPRSEVSFDLVDRRYGKYCVRAGDQTFPMSSAIGNFEKLHIGRPTGEPEHTPILPTTETAYNFRNVAHIGVALACFIATIIFAVLTMI